MMKVITILLLLILAPTNQSMAKFSQPTLCQKIPENILKQKADVVFKGIATSNECNCISPHSLKCTTTIKTITPQKNSQIGQIYEVDFYPPLDTNCITSMESKSLFTNNKKIAQYFLTKKIAQQKHWLFFPSKKTQYLMIEKETCIYD